MSEFKVGDRVKVIAKDDVLHGAIGSIYRFEESRIYVTFANSYDTWYHENEIEYVGESLDITLTKLEQRIEKLEKCVMGEQNSLEKSENVSSMSKNGLLTEDERVILRNLDIKWEWIARDKDGCLCVFDKIPQKGKYARWFVTNDYERMNVFKKGIFQFIKWTDSEPYNIEELLKGECGNE